MKLLAKKRKMHKYVEIKQYTLKQLLDQTVNQGNSTGEQYRGTFKNDFNQMKASMQTQGSKTHGMQRNSVQGEYIATYTYI